MWRVWLGTAVGLGLLAPCDALAKQNKSGTCGDTRLNIGFVDTLYTSLNNNGPNKVGPRRLVTNQSGEVVSKTSRLFIGQTPLDIDTVKIRIQKTGGRAKTHVAICKTAIGDEANQTVLSQFDIPNGKGNVGQTFIRTLNGVKGKRISVKLAGRSVGWSLEYKLYVDRPHAGEVWEPSPGLLNSKQRPVPGFADIHQHHTGAAAFGGEWFLSGNGDGPLPPDTDAHADEIAVNYAFGREVIRPDHHGAVIPNWYDTSHQQMNANSLKGAHDGGLNLMVTHAVNSEWLCSLMALVGRHNSQLSCNDMESMKHQIRLEKLFDEDHDWYEIVTDPWEARRAIRAGHLAVILGVETSDILPSSDGDWRRQLDDFYDMGVRTMFMAHESNSRFAGAGYHHLSDLRFPNKVTAVFSPEIKYAWGGSKTHNPIGLTDLGRQLVREIIDRHMILEVDHISWKAVDDVFDIARDEDYYPMIAGHSRSTKIMTKEHRELSPELSVPKRIVQYIQRTGGMIGLRTGPERSRNYDGAPVVDDCGGSVKSIIQQYRYFADLGMPVAFAGDMNAPFVRTLVPRFGPHACAGGEISKRGEEVVAQVEPDTRTAPPSWSRYRTNGMSDIGTEPSVIWDMQQLGVATHNLETSAQAYIKAWTRAYDPDRAMVPLSFTPVDP